MHNSSIAPTGREHSPLPSEGIQPLQGAFRLLMPEIQRALSSKGYSIPTPIQEQCILPLLEGRDMLGAAQTGTGKTAAFTLPILQNLSKDKQRPRRGAPRALVLSPTRELAAQIGASIEAYGKNLCLSHTVIFGGVNQNPQVRALNRGIDILVATPGRLLDLMQQGYLSLEAVDTFVLDEVDRMLDMGFIPDVKRILSRLPEKRQTLFFSATMPPKMVELAQGMVRNPVRVTIEPDKPAVERIKQKVMFVAKPDKDKLLAEVLSAPGIKKAIVFTQMKHVANKVVRKLEGVGIKATAIHGNKSQAARTKSLDGFKGGQFQVLVATDVAARGLDVDHVSHVVNYDLPNEAETYVHRIGRTARAGSSGDAISFCSAEEKGLLLDIERLLKKPVPRHADHGFHCEEASNATRSSKPQKSLGRPPRSQSQGGGGNHARPTQKPKRPFRKFRNRKGRHGVAG